MKQRHHSTEEIIRILCQSGTEPMIESLCREHTISKATFHRWEAKCGDMNVADGKRLKELKKENAELKTMLAEALLKNRMCKRSTQKKASPMRNKRIKAHTCPN